MVSDWVFFLFCTKFGGPFCFLFIISDEDLFVAFALLLVVNFDNFVFFTNFVVWGAVINVL